MDIHTHSIYKTQNICVCVLRQTLVYVALAWLLWRLHSAFVELESKPGTCQSSYTFTTKTFDLVFCIIFEFYIGVLDIQKAVRHFYSYAKHFGYNHLNFWRTTIWTMGSLYHENLRKLSTQFLISLVHCNNSSSY